jgi:hypothetical protein
MRFQLILGVVIFHLAMGTGIYAWGQDEMLKVGEVRIIKVPFEIRSILSGSDAIVNLNAEDARSVVLTGVTPGRTNVIIIGAKSERKNLSLTITSDERDLIYIHQGSSDQTYFRCDPRCARQNSAGSSTGKSDGKAANLFGDAK